MVSALPSQLSFPMMNSCMKARASESCPGCRKQLFSSRKAYFGILHIVWSVVDHFHIFRYQLAKLEYPSLWKQVLPNNLPVLASFSLVCHFATLVSNFHWGIPAKGVQAAESYFSAAEKRVLALESKESSKCIWQLELAFPLAEQIIFAFCNMKEMSVGSLLWLLLLFSTGSTVGGCYWSWPSEE